MQLTIESKRAAYHTVYLPTILYLSEIWAPGLTVSQTDKLLAMQRKYLLAMTGAFRSTNRQKLMNLFEVLPIDRELECRGECRERVADERKSTRV